MKRFNPSAPQFVAVYRTGGTDNFRWHRTERQSYKDANRTAQGLRGMGYPAHVEDAKRSDAVGLPETYAWVRE